MSLECIQDISTIVLVLPNDLIQQSHKLIVKDSLKEVHNQFGSGIPIMDPVKEMKIQDQELSDSIKKIDTFNKKLEGLKNKFGGGSFLNDQVEVYRNKMAIDK